MRLAFDPTRLLALSVFASLSTACKEEDAGEKGELITRETIGPMGGTIAGGGLSLSVPAGALTADTEFELRATTTDLSARDFVQQGGSFALEPEGTRLRLPAELTISGGPDESAILFTQDGLTVAAAGSRAWINELGSASIAKAGVMAAQVVEPALGSTPAQAGATFRDLARFRVALTEVPSFNLSLTAYDTAQVYDKPLNSNGDGDASCGFQLDAVLGGSQSAGCAGSQITARVRVTSAEIQFDVVPYQSGKLDTPVVVGVVGGADDLAFQLGFFSFDTSPCYAETCSGYGTCEVQGDNAACACIDGYAPGEALSCVCVPDCAGRQCGTNGCGGSCAPGCDGGESCNDAGQCVPDGGEESDSDPSDPTDPTDGTSSGDPTDGTSEGSSSDDGGSSSSTGG